jgi:hypothetical protein
METKREENLLNGAFNNSADNSERLVRSAGSYIVKGPKTGPATMEMLMGAEWSDITGDVRMMQASFGACRYFLAKIRDGQGVMSVSSLDGLFRSATGMGIDKWDAETQGAGREALKSIGQEILGRCTLVWGDHGPEIVTDLESVQVDHMVMAIGNPLDPTEAPTPENAVIFTWHPGMPVAPARISSATVKLH